jgi:AcrR family transcriptional regulator
MSPRTEASFQKIRDERREQILLAALRVFASHSLDATKIADIAAQAQISQGLIHHYFASKESLYVAVAERAMRGALRALDGDEGGAPEDPWQRLEAICAHMISGLKQYPEYLLVVLQCIISEDVPSEARALVGTYGQSVLTELVALIRTGQSAGEIVAGDPLELALTFLATIQGLVVAQFTSRTFLQGTELAREGFIPRVELVLRGLKA